LRFIENHGAFRAVPVHQDTPPCNSPKLCEQLANNHEYFSNIFTTRLFPAYKEAIICLKPEVDRETTAPPFKFVSFLDLIECHKGDQGGDSPENAGFRGQTDFPQVIHNAIQQMFESRKSAEAKPVPSHFHPGRSLHPSHAFFLADPNLSVMARIAG
jgi:hypothetical protein